MASCKLHPPTWSMATKMIKKVRLQPRSSWEASLSKTAKLTRSLAQKIVLYKDGELNSVE